jgi:hypothetical protein
MQETYEYISRQEAVLSETQGIAAHNILTLILTAVITSNTA